MYYCCHCNDFKLHKTDDCPQLKSKRTNEPTRSPQEPFVHQSATADDEPNGEFVKAGTEPAVREAFDVHQSAAQPAKRLDVYEAADLAYEMSKVVHDRCQRCDHSIGLRLMQVLRDRGIIAFADWLTQCEAVDGERAAAD